MTDRTPAPAECLDTETIAAYIDGRVGTDQRREHIEQHLSECEQCYELFIESVCMNSELSGETTAKRPVAPAQASRGRWVGRRGLIAGGALAAAAALWLAVLPPGALVRWWRPGSRPELSAVVAAVGERRAVEGRLTGGFAWGPAPAPGRAPAGAMPEIAELQIATGHLMQEAARHRTAASLAALGTARLAAGQIDSAIGNLEEAVALDGTAFHAWSDLSAAYLARSVLPAAESDAPRALDAANRALELRPGLIEAQFNRALALERMGLRDRAVEAWREYLEREEDSSWAAEAKSRLTELERKRGDTGTRLDLQAPRDRLFDDLLPKWADMGETGGPPATALREEAHELVARMGANAADRLAADALVGVRDGDRPEGLRDGLVAYGRARTLYKASRFDAAAGDFDTAASLLEKAGNAVWVSAAQYRAIIAFRQRGGDVERRFSRVLSVAADRHYPSLVGRSAWMLGVLANARGGYTTADRYYSQALEAFVSAQEPANVAAVHMLRAHNAESSGEPERAWGDFLVALLGDRREGTLLQSAQAALRLGWPYVAAELQDEAADLARSENRLPNVVDALRLQALTQSTLGRNEAATRLLQQAREILATQDESTRDRLQAELDLVESLVVGMDDAGQGVRAATRALEYLQSARMTARLPEALLARARVQRLAGELESARGDLSRAIEILMAEREGLAPGSARMAFAERVRRAGEEIVSIEVVAGRPEQALIEADRLRSWDLAGLASASPVKLDTLRRALGPDTAIVYYAVGRSETFAWVIRRDDLRFHRLGVRPGELQRLVESVHADSLDSPGTRRLFDLTVAPLSDAFGAGGRAILVPDGPLHGLPFAALPGIRSRFLVEDVVLSYAPSIGALISASARLGAGTMPRAVLAVGNPRLDSTVLPNLPTLREAAAEARQVAEFYPSRRVLLEEQATSDALVAALTDVDVLHFAGHAVVNDVDPEASQLGLMTASGEPLSASAVSGLSPGRLRLVVLAACQGLGGRSGRGQGPMSLARAFLRAGVPSVVASRWLVDDHAAVRFSTAFHRAYRETGDAATALHRAQIKLIASPDARLSRPAAWAGWTLIGGDSQLSTSVPAKEKS